MYENLTNSSFAKYKIIILLKLTSFLKNCPMQKNIIEFKYTQVLISLHNKNTIVKKNFTTV